MNIYVYICMYICIRTYLYIYTYEYATPASKRGIQDFWHMLTCTHVHICIYIYTCMYVCMYVYVYTYIVERVAETDRHTYTQIHRNLVGI